MVSLTVVYAVRVVRLAGQDTRVLLYSQDLLSEPHPIHRLVFLLSKFDSKRLASVPRPKNHITLSVLFNGKFSL